MTQLEFMNALRTEEIRRILERHDNLFVGKDLLEIGSGTGAQLRELSRVCKSAIGIEIADSEYAADRLVEILEYDGSHIPFPDASFDLIFSSNVIEHIRNEKTIHSEMHRVLRPGGVCVHIVPTAAWRLFASIAHYPSLAKKIADKLLEFKRHTVTGNTGIDRTPVTLARWRAQLLYALVQRRHGEFGNWFTEHFLFRRSAWQKRFEANGWRVEAIDSMGLAHSGYCLLGERLSWRLRGWLADIIGSSEV